MRSLMSWTKFSSISRSVITLTVAGTSDTASGRRVAETVMASFAAATCCCCAAAEFSAAVPQLSISADRLERTSVLEIDILIRPLGNQFAINNESQSHDMSCGFAGPGWSFSWVGSGWDQTPLLEIFGFVFLVHHAVLVAVEGGEEVLAGGIELVSGDLAVLVLVQNLEARMTLLDLAFTLGRQL